MFNIQSTSCLYVKAESWIEDKLKVAKEESFKNVKDIQDKMKSLKKHQAFEAEIMANADRIRTIKQVSDTIMFRHIWLTINLLTGPFHYTSDQKRITCLMGSYRVGLSLPQLAQTDLPVLKSRWTLDKQTNTHFACLDIFSCIRHATHGTVCLPCSNIISRCSLLQLILELWKDGRLGWASLYWELRIISCYLNNKDKDSCLFKTLSHS